MSSRLRDNAQRALLEYDAPDAVIGTIERVVSERVSICPASDDVGSTVSAACSSKHGAVTALEAIADQRSFEACVVGSGAMLDSASLSKDQLAKRIFDVFFACLLLIIFAPLMLLLCIAVRANSPGPAVFVQSRVGRHGEMFPCLKFRTMVTDAAERLELLLRSDPVARMEWERDQKLRNDVRVTSLGRFLRKTSLDELPQLFNILLGQMSVVGPRPIVAKEIDRYGVHFSDYCAVRPGLTGLWQVGGRNDVDYATRVAFDVEYARTWCFARDLAICWRTVPALLLARGCY